MNTFTKIINTITQFMSYSMLMIVHTWCISMFKQVRTILKGLIKHCKRVVS
jgi:hypothetical protein